MPTETPLRIDPAKRYYARTDAVSTGVRSVRYDPATRTLDIEYPSRETYRYRGVEPAEFAALLAAGSIGGYVNTHIKPRHPDFQKLRAPRRA